MPTLEELREQQRRIKSKIKNKIQYTPGPDWMEFLRDQLPGFRRTGDNSFKCHGSWDSNSYASPNFVTVTGRWSNETLHLLKTIVEMLEAAKRGELEGWPND